MRNQIEKSRDLRKDARDSGEVVHPITHNRWKEPIIPDDVDILANDELSSSSSPSLSLSLAKNARESTKAKSHKRPLQLLALSGAFYRARREARKRQNQIVQALGNASVLPEGTMPPILPAAMIPSMSFVHPAFGIGPSFYMPPTTLIRRPIDLLSSPLG